MKIYKAVIIDKYGSKFVNQYGASSKEKALRKAYFNIRCSKLKGATVYRCDPITET